MAVGPQPLDGVDQRAFADLVPADDKTVPGGEIERRQIAAARSPGRRVAVSCFCRPMSPTVAVAATPPRAPINQIPTRGGDIGGQGRGRS